MPDIESFLTKKIGPLPAWAWVAAGGGILSVVYLSQKGAAATSSTSAPTDTSGQNTGLFAPAPIIVTPGNMPSSTSSANPPAPTSNNQLTIGAQAMIGAGDGQPVLTVRPQGQAWTSDGYIPDGSIVTITGPPTSALWGSSPFLAVPISYAGKQTWTNAIGVKPVPAGMGGGSVLKLIPGSGGGKVLRHTSPHVHPQFLSIAGMGGGGHSHVKAVSDKTKIPPLRIMALNPRMVRPGRRPNALHLR